MKKILFILVLLFGSISLNKADDEPIPEPHPEPPPHIDWALVGYDNGGRYMDFGFNSRPRRTYEILTSTNLNNWTVYGHVTADNDYTVVRVRSEESKLFVCLRFSTSDIVFPK